MPLLFLLQAFRAQNIESAKSRLTMCANDIREELKSSEDNLDLRSQLGAVLGMLGDCWYVCSPLAISLKKFFPLPQTKKILWRVKQD